MRMFIRSCAALGLLAAVSFAVRADSTRPNIVILLADDLGWNDVSFHGGEIATPHIDRIAREGIDLQRFYACPVCSPTRAGLLTGRYPVRYGLIRTVIPPWRDYGLDTDETTLADVLARAGYTHRAVIGKWHLGHHRIKWHPLSRGFTHFHGHYNGNLDYFTHIRDGERDWHLDFLPSDEAGYTTDLIGAAAARFIRQHAGGDSPFFCYVPFNAPHSPLQAKPEDLKKYEHLLSMSGEPRQQLAGMIAAMDDAVGRILSAIDDARVAEETLVLFFSDNGGTAHGDNSPWRGQKGTVFEGGTRVAAAIRWPGILPAGTQCFEPLMYLDVLPTVMSIAGVSDHGGKPLDGTDILSVLRGESSTSDREMFASIGGDRHAVWSPPWKLVEDNRKDQQHRFYLFDFENDPQETSNVADQHPDVVQQLARRIAWFQSLEPEDHVPHMRVGKEGFTAPRHWNIRELSARHEQQER